MKPIKDVYWIEVEKETEDTIMLNGVELYRDTSYDPMRLARQYGTVYRTLKKLEYKKVIKFGFTIL